MKNLFLYKLTLFPLRHFLLFVLFLTKQIKPKAVNKGSLEQTTVLKKIFSILRKKIIDISICTFILSLILRTSSREKRQWHALFFFIA